MIRYLLLGLLLAAAAAIFSPPATRADDYYAGQTHGAYTYRDGYWWAGDYAYTRTKEYYWNCGRQYYRWKYSRLPNPYSRSGQYPPKVDASVLKYDSPGSIDKLVELAAKRDQYILSERRAVIEQQYFLKAVDALGLGGNFNVQGYGQAVGYGLPIGGVGSAGNVGTPGTLATQTPAYGGNSLYGYSYSKISDAYNQADRDVLLNQFNNTTNRAYDLAGTATDSLKDLYKSEQATQERVAAIIADRDKAVAALDTAMKGAAEVVTAAKSPHVRTEERVEHYGQAPASIPSPAEPATFRKASLATTEQKCVSCHSGESAAKGLVLDGSQPIRFDQVLKADVAMKLGRGEISPTAAAEFGVQKPMPPQSSGETADATAAARILAELQQISSP